MTACCGGSVVWAWVFFNIMAAGRKMTLVPVLSSWPMV